MLSYSFVTPMLKIPVDSFFTLWHTLRLLLMLSVGTMPHDKVMHAIELLGTEVAPVVRKEIARRTAKE